VKHALRNRRYLGDWSYGRTETVWQSKADYGRQFQRERPLREHRDESLRIVDDLIFLKAQERIASSKKRGGRRRRNAVGDVVIDPLKDLFWCETHQRYLTPRGHNSSQMACAACKAENTDNGNVDAETAEDADTPNEGTARNQRGPLYSVVNRGLALRLLCEELAQHVRVDEGIVAIILEAAGERVKARQALDPQRLADLQAESKAVTEDIEFILEHPGASVTDRHESGKRLDVLRERRAALQYQLAQHAATAREAAGALPDEKVLRGIIDDLAGVLHRAASGSRGADTDDAVLCRNVLHDLTGGKIVMSQQGETRRRRGYLRGTFQLQLVDAVLNRAAVGNTNELTSNGAAATQTGAQWIDIDFRPESTAQQRADEVKKLFDKGLMMAEIALQLGLRRNQVTLALQEWYASRNLEKPDGRTRRSTLAKKHLIAPRYQQLAHEAMQLYNGGMKLQDIAAQLKCDCATLAMALDWWQREHDVTLPRRSNASQAAGRPSSALRSIH
jgi:hypothetical protein